MFLWLVGVSCQVQSMHIPETIGMEGHSQEHTMWMPANGGIRGFGVESFLVVRHH